MKNRNDRGITQKDVKWMNADNATSTASCYHGYYASKRKIPYIGNTYEGNSALCNKNFGISDGDDFVHIDKVEDDGLKRDRVCGRCLRIFDKLPNNNL